MITYFTPAEAEAAMRQFQKLIPKDVDLVVTFVSPEPPEAFPDDANPVRFITLASVPPEKAFGLMQILVQRYLVGQSRGWPLGAEH